MPSLVQSVTSAAATTGEVAAPELQSRAHPSHCDTANDWLCFWCHHRVASEMDRFAPEGRSEFAFQNPEGARFNLVTFSRTPGCRTCGAPTLEHTWFPGHAWCLCVCERCRMQLGWHYSGPSEFAGLIRERIVRASVMMN